jgi:hypothetical protein
MTGWLYKRGAAGDSSARLPLTPGRARRRLHLSDRHHDNGHTAVVLEPYGYAVVVINLTAGQVYAPITVGGYPTAVAITA